MICYPLGLERDLPKTEGEGEGLFLSCYPLICSGRLGTHCVARGKVNKYPGPLS